jgi:hypothetical protein
MPKEYPLDEFDFVPAHGGRHRIRRTSGQRVREWFLVLTATVVITAAGFYGFKMLGDSNNFTAFAPTDNGGDTQVVNATGPGVTVIDATSKANLATDVAKKLLAAGFNVLTARNLSPLSNPGSANISVVYAKTGEFDSKAQEVATKLGGLKVVTADHFGDPITVVLGSNYK